MHIQDHITQNQTTYQAVRAPGLARLLLAEHNLVDARPRLGGQVEVGLAGLLLPGRRQEQILVRLLLLWGVWS